MTTRPIHPLEEYAVDTFGDGFASVIVHGIRKAEGLTVECLSFDDTCETWERVNKRLLVRKPQSEKWGYRPLVLAALLKLLLGRTKLEPVLNFSFTEVLRELMWPDSSATRREVEDAIGFYFRCSYSRRDVHADHTGLCDKEGTYRLITGYEKEGAMRPQSDRCNDEVNQVSFDETLVEALRHGRIIFANITFGRIAYKHAEPLSETSAEVGVAGEQSPQTDYQNKPSLINQPFGPPSTRPTVRIKATTPVSRRSADLKPKIWARPVGETEISIDTGAIASAVLRALHCTAARHPVGHGWPYESCEAIAEKVHREVDLQLRRAAYSMVRQVRRYVYEEELRHSYGLMHTKEPNKISGERGPRSIWHSADHFISMLLRAIEAIEFEEKWKPRKQGVVLNRRWDVQRVRTATIKLVAAYWSQVEDIEVGQVDSGQMGKWLKSLGLPSFSILRSELRQRIAKARLAQTILQAHEGNVWPFLLLNDNVFSN